MSIKFWIGFLSIVWDSIGDNISTFYVVDPNFFLAPPGSPDITKYIPEGPWAPVYGPGDPHHCQDYLRNPWQNWNSTTSLGSCIKAPTLLVKNIISWKGGNSDGPPEHLLGNPSWCSALPKKHLWLFVDYLIVLICWLSMLEIIYMCGVLENGPRVGITLTRHARNYCTNIPGPVIIFFMTNLNLSLYCI